MIAVRRSLPLLAVVCLLASTAVVHGLRTGRWGSARVLTDAAARLEAVPREMGDWTGTDVPIDERQLKVADVSGHLLREYVHRPTGRRVSMLVVCGRTGAVGAHTPDVCYAGAGFVMAAGTAPRPVKRPGFNAELWSTVATKEGARPETLSIWWSWSTDLAHWEAPRYARWHFALAPVLYKIYLVRRADDRGGAETQEADDLAEQFLEQLTRSVK